MFTLISWTESLKSNNYTRTFRLAYLRYTVLCNVIHIRVRRYPLMRGSVIRISVTSRHIAWGLWWLQNWDGAGLRTLSNAAIAGIFHVPPADTCAAAARCWSEAKAHIRKQYSIVEKIQFIEYHSPCVSYLSVLSLQYEYSCKSNRGSFSSLTVSALQTVIFLA